MFESKIFQKQMYCMEVLVTSLGLFGAPTVIRHLGSCASFTLVTPLIQLIYSRPLQKWFTTPLKVTTPRLKSTALN